MKLNKFSILWAIKQSASISEVAKRLGRPPEDEEKIWNKMLRYYPGAEDFLSRNEDKIDMQDSLANEDWVVLKRARLDFMIATGRLIKNKLITQKDIDRVAVKLEDKRNQKRVAIPAVKEKNSTIQHISMVNEESKDKPEDDTVEITSVVPQDIATSIILK
jgi:hypothetical protein